MGKFVIDEDMPRSTARILCDQGYSVKDIRDCNMRGATDDQIYQFAQNEQATLISGDIGFGNILRFPLGNHFGIIIAHFPNELSINEVNRQLIKSISDLPEDDLKGNLIIVEPEKVRIRRK